MVNEVARQQIMKVINKLSATPSEQSHAFVAIRTMMNWCVRQGYLDSSPVPPMSVSNPSRNRVLTDEEFRQVYQRGQETPYPFGPIVQLIILTGQRRGEIAELRRSWIQDDRIIFPEGFTKNKREHILPLGNLARELIKALPDTGDLLFPARGYSDRPFAGWSKCKARFDKGLGGVDAYTLHDLRRTFATIHAKIGTPIHITERLLNHISGTISGVAAVYNRHSYLEEMKVAMEAYDKYIQDLIFS